MKKLTYKEAYDKIIAAYFRDEIKPFSPSFCFCGTLCNGDKWYRGVSFPTAVIHNPYYGYTGCQLGLMEKALLDKVWHLGEISDGWEDAIFSGMCAALEVLKQIHKERGEDVDSVPVFTKRELVK